MVVAYHGKNLSNMGLDDNIVNWMCLGISILKGYTPEQAFQAFETGADSIKYNKWTEDDERFCIWGRRNGMTNKEIGEALNKRADAVSKYYCRLREDKRYDSI